MPCGQTAASFLDWCTYPSAVRRGSCAKEKCRLHPPPSDLKHFYFWCLFYSIIFGIISKMPGEFKISAEDWVKGACMATAGGVAMNRLGMSEIAAFYLQSRQLKQQCWRCRFFWVLCLLFLQFKGKCWRFEMDINMCSTHLAALTPIVRSNAATCPSCFSFRV